MNEAQEAVGAVNKQKNKSEHSSVVKDNFESSFEYKMHFGFVTSMKQERGVRDPVSKVHAERMLVRSHSYSARKDQLRHPQAIEEK